RLDLRHLSFGRTQRSHRRRVFSANSGPPQRRDEMARRLRKGSSDSASGPHGAAPRSSMEERMLSRRWARVSFVVCAMHLAACVSPVGEMRTPSDPRYGGGTPPDESSSTLSSSSSSSSSGTTSSGHVSSSGGSSSGGYDGGTPGGSDDTSTSGSSGD